MELLYKNTSSCVKYNGFITGQLLLQKSVSTAREPQKTNKLQASLRHLTSNANFTVR